MNVYRAGALYIEPASGGWVVHNVSTGVDYRVSFDVVRILELAADGATLERIAKEFGEAPTIAEGHLRRLVGIGLLSETPAGAGDVDLVQRFWGAATKHFHTATRDADIIRTGTERAQKYIETNLAGLPRPTYTKEYPEAPLLPLPRVFDPLAIDLRRVLETRRTHRDFTREPVTLDQLATLLHYTFAPLRFAHTENWGNLRLLASPAGGARSEAEAYVAVLNVSDVPVGLYHYNSDRHALELLQKDIDPDRIEHLTANQLYCGQAGFVVFVTAVAYRFASKYPHPRAYRILMINLGHLGQTFTMVATGLGLGAFQTAAFRDTELERLLGVDGNEEFATYVLGAGNPVRKPGGLPAQYVPAMPG